MFLNKKAVRFVYTVVSFQNDLASKLWLCLTVVQCLFGDNVIRQLLLCISEAKRLLFSLPSPLFKALDTGAFQPYQTPPPTTHTQMIWHNPLFYGEKFLVLTVFQVGSIHVWEDKKEGGVDMEFLHYWQYNKKHSHKKVCLVF